MQPSLQVLENYVPRYFKDARKVYKEMMKDSHINKNVVKLLLFIYRISQSVFSIISMIHVSNDIIKHGIGQFNYLLQILKLHMVLFTLEMNIHTV
jgi:hypothetical protein